MRSAICMQPKEDIMKSPGWDFGWSGGGEDKAWTSVLTSRVLQSKKIRMQVISFTSLICSECERLNDFWQISATWSSLLLPGMMIPTMLSAIPVSPASIAAAKIFCILTCSRISMQCCIRVSDFIHPPADKVLGPWARTSGGIWIRRCGNKNLTRSSWNPDLSLFCWYEKFEGSPWKRSRRQHSQKAREKKVFRTWNCNCTLFSTIS